MTSALVSLVPGPTAPDLIDDLRSVGIHVIGAVDPENLVREAVRGDPDVVVCWDRSPDDRFFAAMDGLATTSPLPTLVFTDDPAAEKIDRSARSGIHAYVVSGYAPHRLRALIHVAQARFAREQALRVELSDVTHRFEERKLVDRAKGILMRAQQISEEDAFRILRTTSMHSKQRVGRVSQQVIDAARDAESVNRAGLLRMLSQRLVKLSALTLLEADSAGTPALLVDSIVRIDTNLAHLERVLSKATYGDLVDTVQKAWAPLKEALKKPSLAPDGLYAVDALAERLLEQSDQLTVYLQTVGSTRSLRVINVSGRQRMLSQRIVKQALLVDVARENTPQATVEVEATRLAFEQGLVYLRKIPLVSPDIIALLDLADATWQQLVAALPAPRTTTDRRILAEASETLLAVFDRLTDLYERSMQMLMG